MTGESDRREFIRVPFRSETAVRTADRTIRASSTLDLSMNGIRIMTGEPVPREGTKCGIEIALSGSDPVVVIEARGEVVRSEPGTLAVHFTEVDLDSYLHLRQLILNNANDPEKAEQEFRSHWGIRKQTPPV